MPGWIYERRGSEPGNPLYFYPTMGYGDGAPPICMIQPDGECFEIVFMQGPVGSYPAPSQETALKWVRRYLDRHAERYSVKPRRVIAGTLDTFLEAFPRTGKDSVG
jgi:hypothetical protein